MDNKGRTMLALLFAAAVLIIGGSVLGWLGEDREKEQIKIVMKELLPGSSSVTREEITAEDEWVTSAYRGETGHVVETRIPGYVDDIVVWTALDLKGKVTGVTIRNSYETWGLGQRVLWDTGFLRQFLGTQGYAEIGAGIDGISGATVTSKAVAKAINAASTYITGADGITEATEWGDQ